MDENLKKQCLSFDNVADLHNFIVQEDIKDEIDEEVMEYWRKLSDEFNKNYKYPSYREAYKAGLCDIIE